MPFLLCKDIKLGGWHFTLSLVRSWVWDIWLCSKSKFLWNNVDWEGNTSRNRVWSPFWAFCWETVDRWAVWGKPHHHLAVANCSFFSDFHLAWLGGITMEVHVFVWIQPELLRLILICRAYSRTDWNILSANYFLNSVFASYVVRFWWQLKVLIALGLELQCLTNLFSLFILPEQLQSGDCAFPLLGSAADSGGVGSNVKDTCISLSFFLNEEIFYGNYQLWPSLSVRT